MIEGDDVSGPRSDGHLQNHVISGVWQKGAPKKINLLLVGDHRHAPEW